MLGSHGLDPSTTCAMQVIVNLILMRLSVAHRSDWWIRGRTVFRFLCAHLGARPGSHAVTQESLTGRRSATRRSLELLQLTAGLEIRSLKICVSVVDSLAPRCAGCSPGRDNR